MAGTKITKLLTVDGGGKDVVFDGLDFTQDGYVSIVNAKSVAFRNCRVYGLNTGASEKNYWLMAKVSEPIKLTIANCFFGASTEEGGNSVYNLIEPHAFLLDGSCVDENYFAEGCCTHNAVNIYGAQDEANISVSHNVFEVSAGTIRLGMKGSPVCVIEISENKILANDTRYTEADYGLVTVQPFGKETKTFAGTTVTMNGNTCPSEQLIYGYSGKADTPLTAENMPVILVDGEKLEAPIYN